MPEIENGTISDKVTRVIENYYNCFHKVIGITLREAPSSAD